MMSHGMPTPDTEEPDARGPAVIVRGNIQTGFKLIGPFATIDSALEWHKNTWQGNLQLLSASIMLLESPDA